MLHLSEAIRTAKDVVGRTKYLRKFRDEVDFHHKVCYRFEKAYRLAKKMFGDKPKTFCTF
jgi:hypothetical protein